MAELERVSLPEETVRQINEAKIAVEKHKAECNRIYMQLIEANKMLNGRLGVEVRFRHDNFLQQGFLLRGTPMERSDNGKKSENAGYLISPSEIFRNAEFGPGEFNGVFMDTAKQGKFDMRNFLVFDGDGTSIQKAIELSLVMAIPSLPASTNLDKVQVKPKK